LLSVERAVGMDPSMELWRGHLFRAKEEVDGSLV
jgi:hypothetical protein